VPNGIGGVLATVHEITQQIVGERRVAILRDLGAAATENSAEEACRVAALSLARHSKDVPFALLYLIDADGKQARLAGAAGIESRGQASPPVVSLHDKNCLLGRAFHTQAMVVVENFSAQFEGVPAGPWADLPHTAVVVPLRSNKANELVGLLVAGVSARLCFDDLYRGFYELMAGHIATAIARARAYEEERKRAEALAEIDRAKTAFFSNVSHEFRTPLTLMLGPLEDMKREVGRSGSLLNAPQYQQIELIQRNGLRLLKLVNTLLDFSRIEAGRVHAVYEPIDLSLFTAELASVFRASLEKAGIKLIINCPPMPESAYVDREMWEKIVLNLVSNAFKFTFEGEIEVSLRDTGTQFELVVRDTGTGIPPEELPRLFERFHRIEGARGRTYEGSGIGLALVQELARLHGGSVSVQSDYGKGSVFHVIIPRGCGHLPQQQVGLVRTQASTALGAAPFVEEARRWLPDADPNDQRFIEDVGVPVDIGRDSSERSHILFADDNADMREYFRRLLGGLYEVETVVDGEAALAAIEKRIPDLVLSDIMMPRLDGLELVARLRANPRTSTLPIILLSARAGEESRVEGLQTGADDYLIKPFSARELLAHIAANINAAKIRRESEQVLRESEQRFRHMADNAPVMIWVTEADGTCSYLNKSWLEFTGQTPESGLGFRSINAVHPEDYASAHEAFVKANANCESYQVEYRLRRHDGKYRWVIDTASPRVGSTGQFLGYIGSVIDISERKQAEETQQLLIAELNHRVKNTLTIIQAIAQQKGADLRAVIYDQLLSGAVDEIGGACASGVGLKDRKGSFFVMLGEHLEGDAILSFKA